MRFICLRCLLVLVLIGAVASVPAARAAETRGLRIVAKDLASNQSGEVKLYNKSYGCCEGWKS